ncbi:hypothetical protein RQP46_009843 [Phenoliferia psychrophenolica]
MNSNPNPPRLSLLGLPREIQAAILKDAALQDAAYKRRIDEDADHVAMCHLMMEGFGGSLPALSLVCKALRVLAEEHLFTNLAASTAEVAIFELGLTTKYAHAFRTITFDLPDLYLLRNLVVQSKSLPNIRNVCVSTEALYTILNRNIDIAHLAPIARNARFLRLHGWGTPLQESDAVNLLRLFPLLKSLHIEQDACACLGDSFAAAISAQSRLVSLRLDLPGLSEDNPIRSYPLPPCWINSPSTATFTHFALSGFILLPSQWSVVRSLAPHLQSLTLNFLEASLDLSQAPMVATLLQRLTLEFLSGESDTSANLEAQEFFQPLFQPFKGAPITGLALIGPYGLFHGFDKLFPQIKALTVHPPRDCVVSSCDTEDAVRASKEVNYEVKTQNRELDILEESMIHRDRERGWYDAGRPEHAADHRATIETARRTMRYAQRRFDQLVSEDDVVGMRNFMDLFLTLEADRLRSED